MGNPFEDLRQAVVVRPMNSPGPQGAAAPHMKVKYSADGTSWHNDPVETDRYLSFSTDNGITWSDAIYFNNLSETLMWVDKARKWAENPENIPIEDDQYSALHHATRAARSEFNAEAAALDAAGSAAEAFGAAAPAWDSATTYNYNDVVSFDNGHTYRCIGTSVTTAPNIDGIDDEVNWTRITVAVDGFFVYDENLDLMPIITPLTSDVWTLDENGDIMYQETIDLEIAESYRDLEFINSVADFQTHSFVSTTQYVWLDGLTGPGSSGSGIFWRDETSAEADDGYSIIVDADGIRWKRFDFGGESAYATTKVVDSVAELQAGTFLPTIENIYINGYYGKNTPGGGMFYRDSESIEASNGGTILVDADGVRWKRVNVFEEYYASWFGASTDNTLVTDNSPLIQNALDAMPDLGILIFGPGTYECKQTIMIPDTNGSYTENAESTGYVKLITLQGTSGQGPRLNSDVPYTWLRYTGNTPSIPTPLLDFRGSDGTKRYSGALKNIGVIGSTNIVAFWFFDCIYASLESVDARYCEVGFQIDSHCYYAKFNNIKAVYCNDCGFKMNGMGNGIAFYNCNFSSNNIGFGYYYDPWCTGIKFYDCYFEGNTKAIEGRLQRTLVISGCYFELNSDYAIDILNTAITSNPLLIIENSYIYINGTDLLSNSSFVKLSTETGNTISCVLNNNYIAHMSGETVDNFIYVSSGDIAIKADNNRFLPNSLALPLCNVTPLDTSYFNNDFS